MTMRAIYDPEEDVLLLRSRKRTVESIEVLEGVVLDLDEAGALAGLELFDAQEFLSMGNKDITKELLSEINDVQVKVRNYRNYIFITLLFVHKDVRIQEKLPPFSLEEYKSPLLA